MSFADAAPDGAASKMTRPPNLETGNESALRGDDSMECIELQQTTNRKQDDIYMNTNRTTGRHEQERSTKIFKNYEYKPSDGRPYRVQIENTDIEKTKTLNRLKIGEILHQNGFDKSIEDIRKTGRNKVTVYVGNWRDANRLAACKNLQLKNYKAYIPKQFVTITGVISGIPIDMDEEIKDNIQSHIEIESVFRMSRFKDGKKEPTHKMGVVFRSNILPTYISIFSAIFRIQPYIRKPVICYKCLRYNHLSKNCKAKVEKCPSCSEEHPVDKNCKKIKCIYCESNEHKTTDKSCPRWKKESDIQATMAKKSMTYQEARQSYQLPTENQFDVLRNAEEYPTPAESYANITTRTTKSYQQVPKTRNNTLINNRQHKEREGKEGASSLTQKEFVKKRRMEEEKEENVGNGLNNEHRTGEMEKLKKHLEETIKKQTQTQWNRVMEEISTKLVEILKPHGTPGEELSAQIMGELRKAGEWTGNTFI